MLRDGNARGQGTAGAKDDRPTAAIVAHSSAGASGATVAAARGPFLAIALHQAGQLGTPEACTLAQTMLEGIDVLEPEVFYGLSGQLELLFDRSPQSKAQASERSDRWAHDDAERRRQADLVALGVGARAREFATWL